MTRYKYYQPNKLDIKDKSGDCAIRAVCKAEGLEWLDAYDIMYKYSREVQSPMNCKVGFEHVMRSLGYTYHGVSNKKGSKRPVVDSFAKDHRNGTFILVVSNHYVCCQNGSYYDIWDCGHKSLYGYFEKTEEAKKYG